MALPLTSHDEKLRIKGLGRRFGFLPMHFLEDLFEGPHFSSADSLQNSAPPFPLWPSFQASRMWTGRPTFASCKINHQVEWTKMHRAKKLTS